MSYLDISTPEGRAEAVRKGIIWMASQEDQQKACKDIASGVIPTPADLPQQARDYINVLRQQAGQLPLPPVAANDPGRMS